VKANVVAIATTILSLFLFAVAPAGAKAERSQQVVAFGIELSGA
jgi:hypothetical protein